MNKKYLIMNILLILSICIPIVSLFLFYEVFDFQGIYTGFYVYIKANSFAFIKRTDGLFQCRLFDFAYLHSQKPLQNASANVLVLHNAPEHKIIGRTFFYSFFNIEFFLSPPQESDFASDSCE